MPRHNADLLISILSLIKTSGLLEDLFKVYIINYGVDISETKYISIIQTSFPTVTVIQRSDDTSLFEVPTIVHLSHFAKRITNYFSNYNKVNSEVTNL